jgi:photosystem II stability/assembly factor-like uncharacterized protein
MLFASALALTAALHWRNVGPAIGGRVVAVAGVPSRPNLFYFGGVDGGVWRSDDYGLVWENITDRTFPGDNSIGAIAVAPSNPSVIYVGTGESDIRGDVITGDGIYKSTDAGKHWTYAGLGDTHTTMALVVDPRNANVLYVASMGHVFKPNAERGVFKSTDGGKSWHKVLFVDDKTGAVSLAMDPQNPNVLYATTWQAYRTPWKLSSGGPGSGLYKSTDGGAHWTNLDRRPGFPTGVLGKMGVTAGRNGVVYVIAQADHGGVFRSDDGGMSWHRVNSEWKLRQRAFYYMAIFVDPTNNNTLYAPNVDACWVSRDGGRTWTPLHPPHGDNHIVWINPLHPNILLEGNDGGATVSTDGGKTWSTEHNQMTGQFYHVALDNRFPFHIFGAQQDEGSFEGPSATSQGVIPVGDWHSVAYGESTFVAPQPDDPDVTYGSGYFSIFVRYDMRTGEYSDISPWPIYLEGTSSRDQLYRLAWTHPILFSPANPKQLLVGAQYVLSSTDYGQTWQRLSPDLTRNDPSTEGPTGGPVNLDETGAEIYPYVEALAVSPKNGDVIWAGSSDGLVHVTTDGGAHWSAVTPPELPQWCEISSIEPSHFDEGTAYLTASRYMWDDFHPYVYKTTDYGRHWTALRAGIPGDQYVLAIRQDPDEARLLFASTRDTVYVSFNGGAAWTPLTLNLPRVQVRDIAIDTRQGDVVVATHGRSFWVLDNLSLLEQIAKNPDARGETIFSPETAWLSHFYGSSPYAAFLTDAGQNPPFGATVFFNIPRGYNGETPATLTFEDAQGHVIRSFTLHKKTRRPSLAALVAMTPQERDAAALAELTGIKAGMNAFQWDLRYTPAAEILGYQPPVAAGGLEDSVEGPQVVPGTYTAVLAYGGVTRRASFDVALDPGLNATADDLAARLDLGLRIRDALDGFDRSVNRAIEARAALKRAISQHRIAAARASLALGALDRAIADSVQLKDRSSEGSLIFGTRLRDYLAYLGTEVDSAYLAPTVAESHAFDQLSARAQSLEAKLLAATAVGLRSAGR